FSPYNFTLNSPIKYIDPNGMWVEGANGYSTNDPDEMRDFLRQLEQQQRRREQKEEDKKNRKNQEASTIGIGLGVSLEGISGVSQIVPIAAWATASFGVAYAAFDAGINIEATTLSIANVLERLGVPEHVLHSKGGKRNIWPDQYGYPPQVGDVDWSKSDSELAQDVTGESKIKPGTPPGHVKKWFRDKRPK
ncbi:hypothetical protein ACFOUP_16175, partial [Belliella kenyensis]